MFICGSNSRRSGLATQELLIWTALITICVLVIGWSWWWRATAANRADLPQPVLVGADGEPLPAPRFRMTDQEGEPFDSATLTGKVWLIDFIFTNCAGPCPIMTANMRMLQQELEDVSGVHFVSVSCDPWRDTPEVLKRYADAFEADLTRWSFLTGNFAEVQRAAAGFFLSVENPREYVESDSPEVRRQAEENLERRGDDPTGHGGNIIHSSRVVLVDQQGRIVNWYSGVDREALDRLAADARKLASR